MRRALVVGSLLVGALIVQVSVFPWFQFFGSVPELLLGTVVLLGIYAGPQVGAGAGFGGGILHDLFIRPPRLGIGALVFTLVGFAAGSMERLMVRSSPLIVPAMVFGLVLVGQITYGIILAIMGIAVSPGKVLAGTVYTAVVCSTFIPLVRKASEFIEEGPI